MYIFIFVFISRVSFVIFPKIRGVLICESKFDETKFCGDMDFFYAPFMEGDMIGHRDEPKVTAEGVRRDTHTIMRVS